MNSTQYLMWSILFLICVYIELYIKSHLGIMCLAFIIMTWMDNKIMIIKQKK